MKLHRSRIVIVLMLLVQVAAAAAPAAAQSAVPLESVRVDIWPEYDQPSVLVIYHLTLASSVSLPATMSMRIPAAADRPHAVAWESPDQTPYDIKYDVSAAGEWVTVTFTTPAPDVRIEYYDPSLTKDGSQRNFTFRWPGDHDVQNLTLMVQQPFNAANMVIQPDPGSGRQASDGLTYFTKVAGKASAGDTFNLVIRYSKPDDSLTNPQAFQPAQANQPVNSSTAGRVTLDQVLPWAVGGAGLLLIAAGIFWYWRTGQVQRAAQTSGHGAHRHTSRQAAAAQANGDHFCHHCGKKASAGDVFCRACGTKLQ